MVREQHKKINLPPVNVGQMKGFVNVSNNYVFLIVKAKDVDKIKAFIGCDPKINYELSVVVNTYEKMFQELEGLPPKIGFQHEIQL